MAEHTLHEGNCTCGSHHHHDDAHVEKEATAAAVKAKNR